MKRSSSSEMYWWEMLVALPWRKNSRGYDRLKRVWWDQTGTRQWYFDESKECHRVVALFENFSLFGSHWVETLLEEAGLSQFAEDVTACGWSYEFEDAATKRICDIVIHARDRKGEFVVVGEVKRKGGLFKPADLDPESSLQLAPFSRFQRRAFLYLLDETEVQKCSEIVDQRPNYGCISWQAIARLQLDLVRSLDASDAVKGFVAGALYEQLKRYDWTSGVFPIRYLDNEEDRTPCDRMPTSETSGGQTTPERRQELWRIDE